MAKRAKRTDEERELIAMAKTGRRCHLCGAKLPTGETIILDHVAPISTSKYDDSENLLPVCGDCNRLRSDAHPRQIRLYLRLGKYAAQYVRKRQKKAKQRAVEGKKPKPDALVDLLNDLYADARGKQNKKNAEGQLDELLLRELDRADRQHENFKRKAKRRARK